MTYSEPVSAESQVAVESEAILTGFIAGACMAIVTAAIFAQTNPPLWGGWSVGAIAAAATAVAGLLVGITGYIRSFQLEGRQWRRQAARWKLIVDILTVGLVHAVLGAVVVATVFVLLQRSFEGLLVDGFAATGAVGITVGLASYWIYLSVVATTTRKLTTLLMMFVASATLMSMATAQDPAWWEYHFSQLGTFGDFSSSLFNIALIIAGFFVTTFSVYLHRDLATLVARGRLSYERAPALISGAFLVMGLLLAGVGVFPLTLSMLLHNICAAGMSLVFAVMLVSSPFVLRGMPRRFFVFCVASFALLIFAFLLFEPVGYYNLTAFELAAFAIIFGWISVLIRFADALAEAPSGRRGTMPRAASERPNDRHQKSRDRQEQ